MKINHKLLLAIALVVLTALLVHFLIPADHQINRPDAAQDARTDRAAGATADRLPTGVAEAPAQRAPGEMFAKVRERCGGRYAIHKLDATDLVEGERAHLGVYLVKGNAKRELGSTSLGPENYRGYSHVAVAVTDGKAMIERWANDRHIGLSWALTEEDMRECQSLNWLAEQVALTLKEEGARQTIATTPGGWSVVVELWKFTSAEGA